MPGLMATVIEVIITMMTRSYTEYEYMVARLRTINSCSSFSHFFLAYFNVVYDREISHTYYNFDTPSLLHGNRCRCGPNCTNMKMIV